MANISEFTRRADALGPRTLVDQLDEAFRDAGLEPPHPIQVDGLLHRFSTGHKQDDLAGWYCIFGDGVPAGVIGNWRTGETHNFRADMPRKLTPAEEFTIRARIEEARKQRAAAIEERHENAARTAAETWAASSPASPEHPYLVRKGIQTHGARVAGDGRLIIPIYNANNELTSLQFIDASGGKKYLPGGAVAGGLLAMGSVDGVDKIYLAEGFATASTICEVMQAPTVAAFSANNLPNVAEILRKRHPTAEIIIVADNDKSGTGQNYANQAAAKHGARVVIIPEEGQDANDYHVAGGDLRGLLCPKVDNWFISDDELVKKPSPVKWLIKGLIQDSSLMMVHGPSGCGKTFVVLDWALSVAYLNDWNGKKVSGGPVVYLAGEGHYGIRGRVAAWKQSHPSAGTGLFHLSRGAVDLNTPGGVHHVLSQVKNLPNAPRLIIVDTLHRFMSGDENSAEDAKTMIDACAMLQTELNCAVILVHHTGVSEEAQHRGRGSSAWKGALEIEVSIRPDGDRIIIDQRKAKDSDELPPFWVQLNTVEIDGWFDDDGEPVKSAIISLAEKPTDKKEDKKAHLDAERLEAMWAFTGHETREDCPFLTFSGMKRYLMDAEGMSDNTAKYHLKKTGEKESFLKRLLKNSIVRETGEGYIVIDDDIKTLFFLRKK